MKFIYRIFKGWIPHENTLCPHYKGQSFTNLEGNNRYLFW